MVNQRCEKEKVSSQYLPERDHRLLSFCRKAVKQTAKVKKSRKPKSKTRPCIVVSEAFASTVQTSVVLFWIS